MNTPIRGRINWHQAAAEVALIGIGILVALAVDSWWDERQEREAEVEYLKSLQTDFEANRQELLNGIDTEERILELGKTLHSHIETGFDGVSSKQIHQLIGEFFWLFEWEAVTGTYDELVGSGRFLYLRNRELRNKLSQYINSLGEIKTTERVEYTSWYFEQSPFLRHNLLMSNLGWISGYQPTSSFKEDIAALRSMEFHNLVSSWMVAHNDVANNYRKAIRDGDEILNLIAGELSSE